MIVARLGTRSMIGDSERGGEIRGNEGTVLMVAKSSQLQSVVRRNRIVSVIVENVGVGPAMSHGEDGSGRGGIKMSWWMSDR